MKQNKREKVVSIRLSSGEYEEIHRMAQDKYLTASTIGRILIEMFINKEVKIKGVSN